MSVPERRADEPFDWYVTCGMPVYAALAGVRYDRIFREAEAIVEAYRAGRPRAEELFGPDVRMGGPTWAGMSYGLVNALGAPLTFAENSEVGIQPIYASFEEGIRALRQEVDFTRCGLFPFYLRLRDELQKTFPEERIPFGGFGAGGPLTTAWELRGHEFFADLLESPEEATEYLRLVTGQIIRFNGLVRRLNGKPEFSPEGASMADDIAAMIAPARWPEFVLPFHEEYFRRQTSGTRMAHIEDLTVPHLPYLERLGLSEWDPSVSPRLTPELIRRHCRIPFFWRLNSMQVAAFSIEDVERFVYEAAMHGARRVFVWIARDMCTPLAAEKLRVFIRSAKEIQRRLAEGCPRDRLPVPESARTH